jgi:hypothetical protein
VTATQQRNRSRTDEARRNSNQTPKWNGSPGSQVPVLDSDGSADDELAHESGSVVDFDSDEE